MSKAVLISIRPVWVKKILDGEKTDEVRKNKPKIEIPFKCYIYQTLPKYGDWNDRDGRVVASFICDRIVEIKPPFKGKEEGTCLTGRQMHEYANNKPLYKWHISDLKTYGNPKKITAFKRWNRTEENSPCAHVKSLYEPCETCTACNLTRPPQSFCYVNELED